MLVGLPHAKEWDGEFFNLNVNAINFGIERFDPHRLYKVKVKVTLHSKSAEIEDPRSL